MDDKDFKKKTSKAFLPFYRILAIGFLLAIVLKLLKYSHLLTLSEDFSTGITMFQVFYIGFISAIALLDEKRLKLL